MENQVRTQIRLPKGLADWLKSQARTQNRSMNGQLIEFLKQERERSVNDRT